MQKDLLIFLKQFNIWPKNNQIFIDAFTHSTFANENPNTTSYERLEYLGDSLIYFEVAHFLFSQNKFHEGEMSLLRANNVSRVALSKMGKKLKLGEFLRHGHKSEELRKSDSVVSDLFESLVAAIFLDQGRSKLINFLQRTLFIEIKKTWKGEAKDNKTLLQELLQVSSKEPVHYETHRTSNNMFRSIIKYEGYSLGVGEGSTKKMAEQSAAKEALAKYNKS